MLQFDLAKVWRSPVGTGGCVLGLLGCLTGMVPSTVHGQTCADSSGGTGAVESIACPDGAAAIVVPNDTAVPPQLREASQTQIAEQPDNTYNTDLTARVTAPVEVGAGNAFFVSWTGPDNTSDFIAIAKPATQSNNYTHYTYTKGGSPLRVTAPDEPGQYEIRYVDRLSRGVLARQTVTVIAASAILRFSGQVGSGSTFDVSWSGPDNNGDYLAIATPGSPGGEQRSYRYVRQGSPLALTAPDEPGDYEIRYVQRQSRTVLASKSVTVIPVVATLEAAGEVKSGSTFDVSWSGPDNNGDYLAIATPGSPGGEQLNYRYVRQGSPLALTAPDEPGDYKIRYVQRQSRTVLASKSVTVIPVVATLEAAGEVKSGSTFDVSWSGPDNNGDYLAIATPGSPGGEQRSYRYVRQGSPLALTAPDEPGDYEIRYVQRQSRTVLARKIIRVTE